MQCNVSHYNSTDRQTQRQLLHNVPDQPIVLYTLTDDS